MWIHSGDQLANKNKEILEVVEISGLYAAASCMTISLKNITTNEVFEMNYHSEFYPKIEKKDLVPVKLSKKESRGY